MLQDANSPSVDLATSLDAPACSISNQTATQVTVVIPCFNEADGVEQLMHRLAALRRSSSPCGERLEWHFVFVDDGSQDATYQQLSSTFSNWPSARIVRHSTNRGLIAALQTGFQAAETPWVAVIDADCTYDPLLLIQLINKATQDDLDVVTASPYHPLGSVGNVPAWRIALSQVASRLYRWPMRNKLTCYTCCVRVYRTAQVKRCQIRSHGFVGVTELLWHLDREGARMGEVPATLNSRITGVSKMRTFRTMLNHFKLLGRVLAVKLLGRSNCSDRPQA